MSVLTSTDTNKLEKSFPGNFFENDVHTQICYCQDDAIALSHGSVGGYKDTILATLINPSHLQKETVTPWSNHGLVLVVNSEFHGHEHKQYMVVQATITCHRRRGRQSVPAHVLLEPAGFRPDGRRGWQ